MNNIPPPIRKQRVSNIELFRIFAMILIVAHHYVVNGGIVYEYVPNNAIKNAFFVVFGCWGKMGINCFLLITGYFMCCQEFKWIKLLKLILEIKFYDILFFIIFALVGYVSIVPGTIWKCLLTPCDDLMAGGFVSNYIVLYLFVPYINKLISILEKKDFQRLLALLIIIESIVPTLVLNNNYNGLLWFVSVYLVGAYIRLYPNQKIEKKSVMLFVLVWIFSIGSLVAMSFVESNFGINTPTYYLFIDANKPLALLCAITVFLLFKNLRNFSSKVVNKIAAATFGVLLIHANSDTMRKFLWDKTFNISASYNMEFYAVYAISVILLIYIVCVVIDLIRIEFFEKPLFNYLKRKTVHHE